MRGKTFIAVLDHHREEYIRPKRLKISIAILPKPVLNPAINALVLI